MTEPTTIATWIVLNSPEEASSYPSVGKDSSRPEFQEVYWRCIALFFLTARAHNPRAPLMFFCNQPVPEVAPPRIAGLMQRLGVATVVQKLTHRLPAEAAAPFGNAFYKLDVLRHFIERDSRPSLLLLDNDCVWRRPFAPFEARLRDAGCLLYTLQPDDQKAYQGDVLLNGMSRRRMAEIAETQFGCRVSGQMPFHGGEWTAFTRAWATAALPLTERLFQLACEEVAAPDTIRNEEHVWNVLAAALGARSATANDIVRRIWTNFEDVNVKPGDLDLTLWHLPAEKKFGFRRMWQTIEAMAEPPETLSAEALNGMTRRFMGVPQRGPRKAALDVAEKLREKLMLAAGLGRTA